MEGEGWKMEDGRGAYVEGAVEEDSGLRRRGPEAARRKEVELR